MSLHPSNSVTSTTSTSTRPSHNRHKSSTAAISRLTSEADPEAPPTGKRPQKSRSFIAHTSRHHGARVPSYGKGLNKLHKMSALTKPPATAVAGAGDGGQARSPGKKSALRRAQSEVRTGVAMAAAHDSPQKKPVKSSRQSSVKFSAGAESWDEREFVEPPPSTQTAGLVKCDSLEITEVSPVTPTQHSHGQRDGNGNGEVKSPPHALMRKISTNFGQAQPKLSTEIALSKDLNHASLTDVHTHNITAPSSQEGDLESPITSRFIDPAAPRAGVAGGKAGKQSSRERSSISAAKRAMSAASIPALSSSNSNTISRTQQKVLLQRAITFSNPETDENEGASAGTRVLTPSQHARFGKEIERVGREYVNACRFRDPVVEALGRVMKQIIKEGAGVTAPVSRNGPVRNLRLEETRRGTGLLSKSDSNLAGRRERGGTSAVSGMVKQMWRED
ncbi:hypothetical protein SAICODRAFT_217413 [Saitoella complicata NRRL Y-17804]|uniref:Uncharacterized protein n=1 Tax=Saitoella complicata (strain BCRC 22490 / CBS 7301 / JCM 7358 / NBRC 10748 / NRRL Y-17804) TaxID=698492 RepID=A0A0E9NAU8_SAICN|nr:uncharacterized protein SAICODRAFT_217413 [Saitoella complicata NRRL Y-17804]ODQ53805.1 hypothetical protein SAICODRAFT_217413 [Saitoella complicata NRRL Y-17804]GAO46997.1 hypothetical protein G7K_1211-t1 [Saitoella complicata NRRL Y-17804]